MKILHVLAQLPLRREVVCILLMLLRGLNSLMLNRLRFYATTPEYEFNFIKEKFEVEFQGKDISFPIVGMSDIMPYENTLYKNMTAEMLDSWQEAFRKKLKAAKEEFKPDVVITHHLWILSSIVCDVFEGEKSDWSLS